MVVEFVLRATVQVMMPVAASYDPDFAFSAAGCLKLMSMLVVSPFTVNGIFTGLLFEMLVLSNVDVKLSVPFTLACVET